MSIKVGDKIRLVDFVEAKEIQTKYTRNEGGGLSIAPEMIPCFGGKTTYTVTHINRSRVGTKYPTFFLEGCHNHSFNWHFMERWVKKEDKCLEYIFMDKIDIHQLCADSLEDGLNSFLVVGNGMAIIGVLGGGIQIDAEGKNLAMETTGYPYNMAEIDLKDIGFWRKKLIQYSKDYKVWRAELDAHIKDRDRIKIGAHKFKVMGF